MPTIRVDAEVYAWLEGQAQGFDNPNAVLRRFAGLDDSCVQAGTGQAEGRLLSLIRAGLLSAGDVLVWERSRKGETHQATVTDTGHLRIAGDRVHSGPSSAASELAGSQTNGWKVWRCDGTTLDELRNALK